MLFVQIGNGDLLCLQNFHSDTIGNRPVLLDKKRLLDKRLRISALRLDLLNSRSADAKRVIGECAEGNIDLVLLRKIIPEGIPIAAERYELQSILAGENGSLQSGAGKIQAQGRKGANVQTRVATDSDIHVQNNFLALLIPIAEHARSLRPLASIPRQPVEWSLNSQLQRNVGGEQRRYRLAILRKNIRTTGQQYYSDQHS